MHIILYCRIGQVKSQIKFRCSLPKAHALFVGTNLHLYAITSRNELIVKCSTFSFSFVVVFDFILLLIKSNEFPRLLCSMVIPLPYSRQYE